MLSKSGKILAAFESSANKAVREWRVPGMAVAVVTDDRLIYARGFGIKRLGHTSPVNEHTVFQIGSVSKSFTAALVAMLVDRGKITWWDTVKSHLPDFRLADPTACDDLRIIDLLSHRSGLPASAENMPTRITRIF